MDTYQKGPEDDIYPGHPINYVKLDRLPGPTDDWSPILQSIRNGDFWVTTGEVLIRNYAVEGTGAKRTVAADLEWTYPLEFVEVVEHLDAGATEQVAIDAARPPGEHVRHVPARDRGLGAAA